MLQISTDWDRLDAASYRFSVLHSLRKAGWLSVIFGVLAIAAGVLPPPSLFLIGVGLILLVTGAWNIVRPSPVGLVVDGVSLVLLGAYNMTWFAFEDGEVTSQVVRGIVIGVFQVAFGVQRFMTFPKARLATSDPEALVTLTALVRDLARRQPKDDSSVVDFRSAGLRGKAHRMGLHSEGVIALLENREVVRLGRRDEVTIEDHRKSLIGSARVVTVRMGDLTLKGEMAAAHVERFENWKLGVAKVLPFAA